MRDFLAWLGFAGGIWLIDAGVKNKAPLTTLGSLLSGTAPAPLSPTGTTNMNGTNLPAASDSQVPL